MRQFLEKLSIGQKLVLANFLVLAVSLLFASGTFLYLFSYEQNQKLVSQFLSRAQLIAKPAIESLKSADRAAGEELLHGFHTDPSVVRVAIINQHGEVFSQFPASDPPGESSTYILNRQFVWPSNAIDGVLFSPRYMHLVYPLPLSEGVSGELYFQVSLSALIGARNVVIFVLMGIFIFSMVGAFYVTKWLRQTILQPINHLSETMQEIFDNKDFSIQAQPRTEDELGLLMQRFNALIDHVKLRDEALKFHKERLEIEVEAKTNYLKDANAELESTIAALKSANLNLRATEEDKQVAEKSAKTKATFLANMSHELRTPMNGVLGMINLLSESPLSSEQMYFVRVAQDSGTALLAILNDILDLSKIEQGMLTLEDIEFDLFQVIDEVFSVLGESAYKKNVELVWYCNSDVPEFVYGDPVRLKQVIYNVVGNAIKFTASGFVSLSLSSERYQDSNDFHLTFRVTDTGLGIKKEAQKSVFDSFTQADSSTTRRYGGTGLGLALCRQLTELMGGEIKLKSEYGKGSVFTFTLRVRPGENTNPVPVIPNKPQRVFVLDDQTVSLIAVGQYLERLGIDYETTTSAHLFLEKLRTKAKYYDLLVIDLSLPEADSRDLIASIRQEPDYHSTPIILMGSHEQRGNTSVHYAVQTQGHWVKPLRFSVIVELLSRLGEQLAQGPHWQEAQEQLRLARDEQALVVNKKGYRILVVEDNVVNQQVAASRLKKLGYDVDIVDNGEAALRKVKEQQYDIVFMDCQMPVLDGYEATKKIRNMSPAIAGLPIIAMTANAMSGDRERCLAAGMDDYLTKPVNSKELEQVLSNWLS